jgi:hypothetical protein
MELIRAGTGQLLDVPMGTMDKDNSDCLDCDNAELKSGTGPGSGA